MVILHELVPADFGMTEDENFKPAVEAIDIREHERRQWFDQRHIRGKYWTV